MTLINAVVTVASSPVCERYAAVKPQSTSRSRIGLSLKDLAGCGRLNASDAAVRCLKDRSQEKANKFLTYM